MPSKSQLKRYQICIRENERNERNGLTFKKAYQKQNRDTEPKKV